MKSSEHTLRCHHWGLILAGGDGARLLPLTRRLTGDDRPKQFCKVMGDETLLQQTQRRVAQLMPPWRTLLVLTATHEPYFQEAIAELPATRLVVQPSNRGTAPAILNGMLRIREMDARGVVACFPSDHHFSDDGMFATLVESAYEAASRRPEAVILLGIPPQSPEVEYGWIEPSVAMDKSTPKAVCPVSRFWEKPTAAVASTLMETGCLWNSFVMIGHVQAFVDLLQQALPLLSEAFNDIRPSFFSGAEGWAVHELYDSIPISSFSQHVLAVQPDRLYVLRAAGLGWSDLGDPGRVRSLLERRSIFSQEAVYNV